MEIFRPEVHALFLSPFLDEARAYLGDDEVRRFVDSLGVTEESLRTPDAWVSLEFCEAFCEKLFDRTRDPTFFDRCGRLVLTPRYSGMLRPLFRTFGTPMFAYTQVAQAGPRFNKVGTMKVLERRHGFVRLEYRSTWGAPRERGPLICRTRIAQLSGLPTMFDLPPARVRHPICMHKGGESCLYEFEWREPAGKAVSRLAALSGAVAGWVVSSAIEAPSRLHALFWAGGALFCWAFGKLYEMRRDLGQRVAEIHDYHDALTRSAASAEERYAQLLETNTEIEMKVEERTARLSETSARLEATLKQVQALKDAERNFYSNVSHDLRTPLTLIMAPVSELLRRRDLPAQGVRFLETVKRNTEQLRRMIDQLLDLEKVDAGRVELAPVPIDPSGLLRTIEEQFSAAAVSGAVALETEGPEMAAEISVDIGWITSALQNLVVNALRFARHRVSVRLREEPPGVVFEVEDDGSGIAPEDLPRIFDRFAQGGDVARRRTGTGLGLALAREAARLHGGALTVTSTLGEGSTFRLALPPQPPAVAVQSQQSLTPAPSPLATPPLTPPPSLLATPPPSLLATPPPVSVAAVGLTPPPSLLSPSPTPATPATPAPRAVIEGLPRGGPAVAKLGVGPRRRSWAGPTRDAPLVLVVEDDDDLRELIGELLAERYRVEGARDGVEGLAAAQRLRPDAIVSDIAMPRMDGYQMCKAIRAQEEGRRVPIIFLTARALLPRLLEGFEAGADDYVTKPFHVPELMARVGVHLLLGRLVKEMAHRERLATLGLVAASIAHQVRNPLSALQNTVESLRERVDGTPRTEGMFELIAECTSRIEKLTDDLLDLSRVDREGMARFRPADGIRACIRVLTARLPPETRIVTKLDDGIEVLGRPGDLNHVFLNLIDNAARAVAGAGTVLVEASSADGCFVFEVGDSGPGIPEPERDAIFEPFYSTREAGQGTGLGLFLVKKVVSAHQGSVSVGRSDLGGASFVVRLPSANPLAAAAPAGAM
jgi:signal transduction histidine kinase